MYLIYWIKPDGSIGTAKAEISADLHEWTELRGKYLRSQPYVYDPRNQLWATYINMYARPKPLAVEKDWKVISPATVPAAIRAYHLITH